MGGRDPQLARVLSVIQQQPHVSWTATAAHVGYGSEAAFSNTFRRRFGSAPGAYRTANARIYGSMTY